MSDNTAEPDDTAPEEEAFADIAVLRAARQRVLVPPEGLARCHVVLAGCGAVGRQTLLQLAAMGVPSIAVFDHDAVSVENLAPQGWREADLGRPKVEAAAEEAKAINPRLRIDAFHEKFSARAASAGRAGFDLVAIGAGDSMTLRKQMAAWAFGESSPVKLLLDARVGGELAQVHFLPRGASASRRRYERDYLFSAAEATPAPCGAKMTIYMANLAAAFLCRALSAWLRQASVPAVADMSIGTSEFDVLWEDSP